ncbi:MAG: hypothetical protein QOG91_472 [Candidatus Parcubacteria bacterium]|nr:hypothetical protein [Candidatus Parcubacteria bacterium]
MKYKNIKLNLNTLSGKAAASRFEYAKSLEKKEDLEKDNISVLKIKDRKTVEQKIAELRNDPDVEYAQPNFQYYPDAIDTNDPNRGSLWGLDNTGQTITGPYGSRTITYVPTVGTADADIDAPEAWAVGETAVSAPVIVAVIDTGVAYNHPDLAANMWNGSACIKDNGVAIAGGCIHGFDYEDIDITPLPTTSAHGTHVAGTIAAAKGNGLGVIGVAPHAKIMAIKTSFTTANIVRSMSFAKINGAKIVNASWGSNFFNGTYGQDSDQALYNAIKNFPGIFVTAAGNNAQNHDSGNPNTIPYPAGFGTSSPAGPGLANIIVAAATDQKDALATFSDYGSTTVDVGAPGTNILSSVVTNISVVRETFEGTSTPNLPSGWIKGGLNNKWGTYDFKDGIHGKVLYGYALSGPYDNNSNTTVSSPKFNLAGASRANISFFARCDTEYVTNGWTDYMQLEYSADGGLHFSTTTDPYNKSSPAGFRWDEATFDRLNGAPPDGGGLAQFNYRNIPIPARYLTSDFKLRFRWVTDSSDNLYDGCLVDDITITKFSDGSDNRYDYLSGTSMAVPHVAGLAALVEAYNPSLSTAQVKKAILAGSDRLPGLFGKTNSGRRINAYGALHAVDPGNP